MKVLMATVIALVPALMPAQDLPVVERGRVGSVTIGALAENIYGEFGDRARLIDLKLEGQLSPALEIKFFGAQATASLVAEIRPSDNKLVVTRIQIFDPRLRTKDGIGIGSTYADLRSKYSVDWVGWGEGDFVARVEAIGISFTLDLSGVPDAHTIRNPARVPPDARVVGMLLTR